MDAGPGFGGPRDKPRAATVPDAVRRAPEPSDTGGGGLPAGVRREFIVFLVLLAFGLFLMPLLIWVVGHSVLGPYANGNAMALLADFFTGLKSGTLTYWSVVFGPYVFVLILRGLWHFMRQADRAAD